MADSYSSQARVDEGVEVVFRPSGAGGGKGGGSPEEAPDSLKSNITGRVVDLVAEGPIGGLVKDDSSIFLNQTRMRSLDGVANFEGVVVFMNNGTGDQPALPGFDDVRTTVQVAQDLPADTPVTISFNDVETTAVIVTISTDSFLKVEEDGDVVGTSVTFKIERAQNSSAFEEVGEATIRGKQSKFFERDFRVPISDPGMIEIRVTRTTPEATSVKTTNDIKFARYTKVLELKVNYEDRAVVGTEFDAKQFGNRLPNRQYHLFGSLMQVPSNYDPRQRKFSGAWDGTWTPGQLVDEGGVPDPDLVYSNNPSFCLRLMLLHPRFGLGNWVDESLIDDPTLFKLGKWSDEMISRGKGVRDVSTTVRNGDRLTVSTATGHRLSRDGRWQYVMLDGFDQAFYNDHFFVDSVTDDTTFVLDLGSDPGQDPTGTSPTADEVEPRFAMNAAIRNRGEAFHLLSELVSTFRGMLYWVDAKAWAVPDQPRSPVKLVTNSNVRDGDFNYSGESERQRYSVVEVSYADPDNLFKKAVETVEDNDLRRKFGFRVKELGSIGIASRTQARRQGLHFLRSQEVEDEVVSYQAAWDHDYLERGGEDGATGVAPGDHILIADEARGNAVAAGRVVDFDGVDVVTLDRSVEADGSGTFHVEHMDGTIEELSASWSGDQVTLAETPATAVVPGEVYLLIEQGFVPEEFVVISVEPVDEVWVEVIAKVYDETKHDVIDRGMDVDREERMTLPDPTKAPPVRNVTAVPISIVQADRVDRRIKVDWDFPLDPNSVEPRPDPGTDVYLVRFRRNDDNWTTLPTVATSSAVIPEVKFGTYEITVQQINALGTRSDRVEVSVDVPIVPTTEELAGGSIENLTLEDGGTQFDGTDAHFEWDVRTPAGDLLDVVAGTQDSGKGVVDPMMKDVLVEVRRTDGTILRQESVVATEYVYSMKKNQLDNRKVDGSGPVRSFEVRVFYRDKFERVSPGQSLVVSNPQPAAPAFSLTALPQALKVSIVPPGDDDLAGFEVHVSDTSGFTPDATTLVHKGPERRPEVQVGDTAQRFVRVGSFDAFDDEQVTMAAEQSVTPSELLADNRSNTGMLVPNSWVGIGQDPGDSPGEVTLQGIDAAGNRSVTTPARIVFNGEVVDFVNDGSTATTNILNPGATGNGVMWVAYDKARRGTVFPILPAADEGNWAFVWRDKSGQWKALNASTIADWTPDADTIIVGIGCVSSSEQIDEAQLFAQAFLPDSAPKLINESGRLSFQDGLLAGDMVVNTPAEDVEADSKSRGQNLLGPNTGPENSWTTTFNLRDGNIDIPLDVLELEIGELLSARAKLWSATGADRVRLFLRFRDSNSVNISQPTSADINSDIPQDATIEGVEIPAGTAFVAVFEQNRDTTETAFSRALMLNRGPKALPFEEPPFRSQRETADDVVLSPQPVTGGLSDAAIRSLGSLTQQAQLVAGILMNQGSEVARPGRFGLESATLRDGDVVAFANPYLAPPKVAFSGGIQKDGFSPKFVPENLSVTGFTASLKIVGQSTGTTTKQSGAGVLISGIRWEAGISTTAAPNDGKATWNYDIQATSEDTDGDGFPDQFTNLTFEFFINEGGGWVSVGTAQISAGANTSVSTTKTVGNDVTAHSGREFAIELIDQSGAPGGLDSLTNVTWEEDDSSPTEETATPTGTPDMTFESEIG